ncbi:capsid portal protein [Psittacid alphaherpesvirus 5]|uniref:Capsid portal protein n=1 Tax=Psittacid alphaherpesvirus 5 TaxID=2972693 RepID=A0A5P9JSD7_9ALPH|nr:capsid portal protein [Psittacid alphaherpesvirus 5]QFU14596.1 capsid portal protein [Psittacid alphaherpesvirus 5]UOO01067.1 capsid portal protein [Psittacid alphaherpesvirus 5]
MRWCVIHPTTKTLEFREILLGGVGYYEGQGLYNAVRNTEVVTRQIQVSTLREILDGCRFEDIISDWSSHLNSRGYDVINIARRYGQNITDALKIAERLIDTWICVLQRTLSDLARDIAACCTSGSLGKCTSYTCYIDWLTCLGIVPVRRGVVKMEHNVNVTKHNEFLKSDSLHKWYGLADRLRLSGSMFKRGADFIAYLSSRLESVEIMPYDRTVLVMDIETRVIRSYDMFSGVRGDCIIFGEPMLTSEGPIFDAVMQRLYLSSMRAYATREHAKLCQLANTTPLHILLARREKSDDDSAVLDKLIDRVIGKSTESSSENATGRLIKLMVNMKSMRNVGDVSDAVDAYLKENTNNILGGVRSLDPSRAGFGRGRLAENNSGGDTLADSFRAAVVTNINNVLEGHVSNLLKAVEDLRAANIDLVNKNTALNRQIDKVRMASINARDSNNDTANTRKAKQFQKHLSTIDPFQALETLSQNVTRNVVDLTPDMRENTYVANSFQSRYIPPYLEEEDRLSKLWEQEIMRSFKLQRATTNQGQELTVLYSDSSISLITGPYFTRVLLADRIGFLISRQDVYKSEEELCVDLFRKSRISTYLDDLRTTFLTDVNRACLTIYPSEDFKSTSLEQDYKTRLCDTRPYVDRVSIPQSEYNAPSITRSSRLIGTNYHQDEDQWSSNVAVGYYRSVSPYANLAAEAENVNYLPGFNTQAKYFS